MKRFISMLLSIVLAANLFSIIGFAENKHASTLVLDEMSEEMIQAANEEMAIIKEVFSSDSVEPLALDENGDIVYLVQSAIAPDAEITVNKTEDGSTRFFVVEGELENELIFSPDGKIFLDGKEVLFSYSTSEIDYGITPMARWSMYSEEPIIGEASDYNNYARTETGNIEFQEAIIDLAVDVIKAILQTVVPSMSELTDAMLDTLAIMFKNDALVKGPDSTFITYEIDVYSYKERIPLEVHLKYVGRYYYTSNYTGPYTSYTYYYANMFS